ncbi:MAG: DUF1232 domain-containing protein [Rikenellaceae bacterium]|nr:DUF1232 domain-containing protein [Rikenellaceae bacterium]
MHSPKDLEKYRGSYSERGLMNKLSAVAKKAGIKAVYAVLLLYYALQSPQTSTKDKSIIYGALGYFILPLDLVPDFIPLAGFGDDLGALVWAISRVVANITDEVRQQARTKLHDWFGDYDQSQLRDVE